MVTVTNLATNDGVDSGQLLDRIRTDQTYRGDLASADLISIQIGFNDWRACNWPNDDACWETATASVEQDLSATLDEIRTLRGGRPTALRVLTYPNMFVGALIVSAIATTVPSSAAQAGAPTTHLEATSFSPQAVIVPKGQKLHVVADSNVVHILANGTWAAQTPHPAAESGAPTVANVTISGGSVDLGPFTTSGTYHIYCTVHPGMTLTVFVP